MPGNCDVCLQAFNEALAVFKAICVQCHFGVPMTLPYEGVHRMQGQHLDSRTMRQKTHKAALMQ